VIDLKQLRENPDAVRRSQRARGEDPRLVDVLLDADVKRRAAVSAADNLRAEQKTVSKQVGSASAGERPAILECAKRLAADVKAAVHDRVHGDLQCDHRRGARGGRAGLHGARHRRCH
jgi:seryl-tRNA synthetase